MYYDKSAKYQDSYGFKRFFLLNDQNTTKNIRRLKTPERLSKINTKNKYQQK